MTTLPVPAPASTRLAAAAVGAQPSTFVGTRPAATAPLRQALRLGLLAFGITWPLWWTAALAERGVFALPVPPDLLFVLGGVGPSLAAVLLTALGSGRAGVRELLSRALRWRCAPAWYAAALLGPFALHGVAMGLHVALGGQPPNVALLVAALPGVLASLVPVFLLFGPLGEEFGWRGYALPRLQVRFGALVSSVALGLVWATWHLPLFFDPTQSYAQLSPPVYAASMIGLAVLFTWLYNGTGGSLLLVMLAHTVINASGGVWAAVADHGSDAYQLQLMTVVVWVAVAVVVAANGARHLARRPRQVPPA